MRLQARITAVLISLLYGLGLLAPPAHEIISSDDACSRCEEELAAGPAVEAPCGGPLPCSNPKHHHHQHRRHDHGQCPLCQHGIAASARLEAAAFQTLPVAAGSTSPRETDPAPRRRPHLPHLARAPPPLS